MPQSIYAILSTVNKKSNVSHRSQIKTHKSSNPKDKLIDQKYIPCQQ